ncbi:MAG: hypothetical protein HWQ37_24890 [Nostoc sp. NMS4]|nr:hypothetical protein [Nostoc sp. NMS4]
MAVNKDPRQLLRSRGYCAIAAQKIQRVHNHIIGSLPEKGFLPPQFY